jgi:hypothetical protein
MACGQLPTLRTNCRRRLAAKLQFPSVYHTKEKPQRILFLGFVAVATFLIFGYNGYKSTQEGIL